MILITGATGLLGRVIVLELLKMGKNVRACKRPDSDLSDIQQTYHFYTSSADFYFDQIEWFDIDFNSRQSLYEALQGVSEVYHCAAKVSFDPNDRGEVLETGIVSTRNLLSACRYMRVKKFLFVSSAAVLHVNKQDLEFQIKKDYSIKKYYPAYLVSKYICEKLVHNANKGDLKTVIINPGMIIGSGNWKKKQQQIPNFFLHSKFTFSGGTSCVDVRDVANTAVHLMENNIFGERFCIFSENMLYKDIATQIRKVTGQKKPIVCSRAFLRLLKPLRVFLEMLDSKAHFMTDENIEFISCTQYDESNEVRNVIPHDFYSVSDSIKFHYRNYLLYTHSMNAE